MAEEPPLEEKVASMKPWDKLLIAESDNFIMELVKLPERTTKSKTEPERVSLLIRRRDAFRGILINGREEYSDLKQLLEVFDSQARDRVLDVLEKASELVEETAIDSEKDAELIMAAKYRLEEAKENFVKANKTASIHGKLYLLAYSEQKAYASIAWLNITERFSEGRELQLSYVRKIASDYLLAARNSWSYAYTLMSESNILLEEVNRAEEAFGKARSAFEKGDYLLSCAFAIEALVESELALNKIHLKSVQRDITDILVEKARERALYVLSIAQNFTVPILASSYMELADYEENYETKLKLYKLSSYYSKLACQLARVRTLKKTTISERKEMNVASGEEAGKGNLGNTTYYPLATPLIVIGVLLVCYIVVRTRLKRESTTITSPQILCVDKG